MIKKRVLVVGGAGYIGGYLTDLLEKTHNVLVYDSLLYENLYLKNVNFVHGDVRDIDKLKTYLKWADHVVWLAAIVGDKACAINEKNTRDINTESVKTAYYMFRELHQIDVFNRFVFFSTCSVYGVQPPDILLTEYDDTNPISVYAQSKLEAEKIFTHPYDTIIRLGTVYGVGDAFSRVRMDLVVNRLSALAAINQPFTVYGGSQYRPLIHVRNVGYLVWKIINRSQMLKDIKLILAEGNYTIADLAGIILRCIPFASYDVKDIDIQDARNYAVNLRGMERNDLKLRSDITPNGKKIGSYTLEDGIFSIYELIRSRRIRDINDVRFSNYDYLNGRCVC